MRAYRINELKDATVFEVDFPATQQLKRNKLKELNIAKPEGLIYVPIDFNRQRLDEVLSAAGFNPKQPTFFVWEGVTMYLDSNSVDATLQSIRALSAPNSFLYFDYLHQSVLNGTNSLPEAIAVRESQSFAGRGSEKYTYGIEESEMKEFLAQRGFNLIEHSSGDDLKQRYFHGEGSRRYVFRICGFVLAQARS
jgi:methyltransferase (TIGR00027 family)